MKTEKYRVVVWIADSEHPEIEADEIRGEIQHALRCGNPLDEPTTRVEKSIDGGKTWRDTGGF
jgi:hypothetical protein